MAEVIPAILEQDFSAIEKKIHSVEGLVSWVQIDIADDTLVPNTTFLDPDPFAKFMKEAGKSIQLSPKAPRGWPSSARTPPMVKESEINKRQKPLNFELHMMVKDPLRYLERFVSVGFKRFYAHVEGDYVEDYIAKCYQLGVEVGLAIDGPTPFEKIHPYLDNLDCVLVMAIQAGFSGQPFREDTVEKIKKIKEVDLPIPISVDGAMIPENAAKVVAAGATRINSNSFIFSGEEEKIGERIKVLQNLALGK